MANAVLDGGIEARAPEGPAIAPGSLALSIRGRRVPVRLPSIRDARLHTASVLLTVQVLGQVVVGFELSIAQILVSIGTCAAIEVATVLRRDRVLAWPASAMLTGNGIALLLRVNGTEHGDWWSLRGWWIFAGTAALGMATKAFIRVEGRHLFNPSNVALVICFVVLGTTRVNPQDLWWGPRSVGLVVTWSVIFAGGVIITRRLHLIGIAVAFWLTYAAGIAVIALSGHAMRARWSFEPVSGWTYWTVLVTSPEILIFLFFMITDPRTVPRGRAAHRVFGVIVGATAAALVAFQSTEFSTKVAILAGLTVATLLRPRIDRSFGLAVGAAGPRRSWPAIVATAVLGLGAILVGTAGDEAPARASAIERPEVALGDLPAITVADDATTVNASIDGEAVARDVLTSLELQRRAIDEGDPALAELAVTGTALADTLAAIDAGAPAPAVPDIEALTIDLVRLDEQALPRFGVVATVREGDRTVERTYLLERVGGVQLIARALNG